MKHKVLIVGLGQIGMGYDLEKNASQFVLTHSRAFHLHPAFKLAGGVDIDAERRSLFEKHYNTPAFDSIASAVQTTQPDIIVICTPTQQHLKTVTEVLKHGTPKVIICEKPLAYNLEDAQTLVAACENQGVAVYVNYMRVSDLTVHHITQRLISSAIQTPTKGVVWYSKGLYNGASHFINLLQHWLGEIKSCSIIKAGRIWNEIDPEPDFILHFEKTEIHFLAARAEDFFHNTIELICPNGRLHYSRGGSHVTWESTLTTGVFSGYTVLENNAEVLPSDFLRIQWHFTDALADKLADLSPSLCTAQQALATLKVVNQIEKARSSLNA